MAGEIEDYVTLQADHLPTGSISFGRFEAESLSWERRSSFSHNRYLEEVEKYSTPGSVTQKKAYFEAHFKKKALEHQASSESQTSADQNTENNFADSESYFNEFEIHDDGRQLQFSWYDETSELLDDHQQEAVDHEQEILDYEEIDYEQEVIAYEREESPPSDFPIEAKADSADRLVTHVEAPEAQIGNETIQSDKDLLDVVKHKLENEDGTVEGLCEKDKIYSKIQLAGKGATISLKETQKISPKVKGAVGEETAKPKLRTGAQNSRNLATEKNSLSSRITKAVRSMEKEYPERTKIEKQSPLRVQPSTSSRSRNLKSEDFESLIAKARQQHRSESDLRAKKSVAASQSIREKSESSLRQSANRPRRIVNQTKEEVQRFGVFSFKSDERAEKRKEFYMKLEEKHHAREAEMNEIQARAQEEREAKMKQFRRSLNFKATPMPSFYRESMPRASDGKKIVSTAAKFPKVQSKCSSPGVKAAAQTFTAHSKVSNQEGSYTADLTSSPQASCPAALEGGSCHLMPDNKPDTTDELGDGSQTMQPLKKNEEGTKEGRGKPSVQQQQGEDKLKRKETSNNKVRRGVKGGSEVVGNVIKGGDSGNLAVHVAS